MIEFGLTEFEFDGERYAWVDIAGYLLHLRVERSRIYAGTKFVVAFRHRMLTVFFR